MPPIAIKSEVPGEQWSERSSLLISMCSHIMCVSNSEPTRLCFWPCRTRKRDREEMQLETWSHSTSTHTKRKNLERWLLQFHALKSSRRHFSTIPRPEHLEMQVDWITGSIQTRRPSLNLCFYQSQVSHRSSNSVPALWAASSHSTLCPTLQFMQRSLHIYLPAITETHYF